MPPNRRAYPSARLIAYGLWITIWRFSVRSRQFRRIGDAHPPPADEYSQVATNLSLLQRDRRTTATTGLVAAEVGRHNQFDRRRGNPQIGQAECAGRDNVVIGQQ
jgi:hypothetical protein